MSKSLLFIAALVCSVLSRGMGAEKPDAALPLVDVALNTGILWLGQATVSLNIAEKFYVKYHISTTSGSEESGINGGYQFIFGPKSRLQAGLGYTHFGVVPGMTYLFGGDEKEFYNGWIGEVDYIHYLFVKPVKIGFNVGLNWIAYKDKYLRFTTPGIEFDDGSALSTFPSLNVGVTAGIF